MSQGSRSCAREAGRRGQAARRRCLSAADCPASHDCTGKQCIPFRVCKNSTDCRKAEMCDKVTNHCVLCLGDNDCTANQLCEQGKCNAFVHCSSDKRCTDKDLLCDRAKGKCAQCPAHSDGPGIYNRQAVGVAKTGVGVLDVCSQGQGACSSNASLTCTAKIQRSRGPPSRRAPRRLGCLARLGPPADRGSHSLRA